MENDDIFDLSHLIGIFKKHIVFILIAGFFCAAAAFCVSEFAIDKKYISKALLYVENNSNNSESLNLNDITASQQLVYTCQIIFKSSTIRGKLVENLQLPYSKEQLDSMITIQVVNKTQVMKIIVETTDPEESQMIVNELVKLSKNEFSNIIKTGSLEVIDYGEKSKYPSSPNVKMLTLFGLAAGLAAAYAVAFIEDLTDVAVKHDDNLAKRYNVPVFANINNFQLASDVKYEYYGSPYARARNEHLAAAQNNAGTGGYLISDSTPFAIMEAYNTARTNIMFAVSTSSSKIIAVTSSNSSDGKSTTCANIAVSFANAGMKVLLIECDLRKPTISKIFGLKPPKGLSSLIGGFCEPEEALCSDVIKNLDVITAGDIPPNPSELLTSDLMKNILSVSVKYYDYVFLDTPPVNVVTDSQLLNDEIAGFIFIVREGKTTHPEIQNALEKIRLANGKTLGMIKTFCRPEKSVHYGRKNSPQRYGYGYSRSESESADKNTEQTKPAEHAAKHSKKSAGVKEPDEKLSLKQMITRPAEKAISAPRLTEETRADITPEGKHSAAEEKTSGKKPRGILSGLSLGSIPRIILAVCMVVCLTFIWVNSMMPDSVSSDISGYANEMLSRMFEGRFDVDDFGLRRIAHFCEFTALGLILTLINLKKLPKRLPLIFLCGVSAALCDETIQLFSDGRSSQITDIWIDMGGFTCGALTVILIMLLVILIKMLVNIFSGRLRQQRQQVKE